MSWTAEFKAHVVRTLEKEIAGLEESLDRLVRLRSRVMATAIVAPTMDQGIASQVGLRRLMRMSAERKREDDNVVDEGTVGADPRLDEIDDGDDGLEVAIHNSLASQVNLASSSSTIPHSSSSSSSTSTGVRKQDKK